MLNSSRDTKLGTYLCVVGKVEKGPLCDPGSELLSGGSNCEEMKYTHARAARSKTLRPNSSTLQAVCDTPIARITGVCVLVEDIGRRLPLQLEQ